MRRDTRGQAVGFIIFALILAIGALLWGLLDPAASQLFDLTLQQTSKSQAEGVIKQRRRIWNNILFFIVALAGVFLIARAVRQSQT